MLQKLNYYGFHAEVTEAVDGSSEPNLNEYDKYVNSPVGAKGAHPLELKYNKKLIQSPGAWGYLKTYHKILEQAKISGYRRILCFDDDVLFHKNFHAEFDRFIREVGENWKLLYLGATQHTWNLPKTNRYRDSSKTEYDVQEPFYYPLITDGSFAIGIDSSIYDLLIEEIERFNAPFDSGPLRRVCELYQEQCFVAQPNLVIADVSDSNIGIGRNQYELAEKVKWDMELYDIDEYRDLVSVIVPAFNAELTIEKCLMSVINQTYPRLEVIVADDGSTDNTVEVVKKIQARDSRITLLENKENRGCYFVRNDAIRQSRGRYIAIQDADDISLSTRIERQLIPLVAGQAEFVISRIYRSRCRADEFDLSDDNKMIQMVQSRRIPNSDGKFEYRDREILGLNSSMFSRSLFEKLGLFWEKRFASDAEFCERILFHLADVRFYDDENVHTFLRDCDPIEGLYKRIDEVLVISTEMGEANVTNRHRQEEKLEFRRVWRSRLSGEIEYEYPKLDAKIGAMEKTPLELANDRIAALNSRCNILEQKLKVRNQVKDQMLESARKQVVELENGLSWYDRTYGHLPKWYLKIGGIFRRWPCK